MAVKTEAKTENVIEPVNEWEIKEEVFIPVISGEEDYLFVSLNNYTAQIPRGQRVNIPKPVADMLRERDSIIMQGMVFAREEAKKATRSLAPDGTVINL